MLLNEARNGINEMTLPFRSLLVFGANVMRSCLVVTPGPNLIAWREGIIRKEAFI